MFGSIKQRMVIARYDKDLIRVLSRTTELSALEHLTKALGTPVLPETLDGCIIVLDSSGFLRLAGHEKSADVVDYLNSQHTSGLIVPGQAIQEFWKNRYSVIPSVAKNLNKNFQEFKSLVGKLEGEFGDYKDRIEAILQEFDDEHGHIFDESTVSKLSSMLDVLGEKAVIPFVDRSLFHRFAEHRHTTKTPPGFRDASDNHGDYFIWVDLLRGVQLFKQSHPSVSRVLFVTEDKKDDWSRDGTPHPILSAEIAALFDLELSIIDLKKLVALVANSAK